MDIYSGEKNKTALTKSLLSTLAWGSHLGTAAALAAETDLCTYYTLATRLRNSNSVSKSFDGGVAWRMLLLRHHPRIVQFMRLRMWYANSNKISLFIFNNTFRRAQFSIINIYGMLLALSLSIKHRRQTGSASALGNWYRILHISEAGLHTDWALGMGGRLTM